MDLASFKVSMESAAPPETLGLALRSLWYAGKGDWQTAHGLADSEHGSETNWVHAYLHRAEGDHSNAGYWYRRAGRDVPTVALEMEWQAIVESLLRD